jgi:hypothetical protein
MFKKDTPYRRAQIQQLVGGEIRTYLPQKDKRILAGCFSVEMNPKAPIEIFAGNLPKVVAKAELLGTQPENAFPVFIRKKNSDRKYFFHGYYKCTGITNKRKILLEAESLSGRRGELSYVLYLRKA